MNPREFYLKVVEMRDAQKSYFRSRNAGALQRSKALEAEIDAEIKRVQDIEAAKYKTAEIPGLLTPEP